MRAHIIEENKIVNTIEVESLDFMPNLIDASLGGSIGWEYRDGSFIEPYREPEPTYIPQRLKMAQCRAQLIIDGKDDDVELLINSIEDPIKQKLYRAFWEYEPIVLRDNAMINEMAPALAIDLDTFFINASKL